MYDLHDLGWNSFQHLCLTITREIFGQTVESFLGSGDGGRAGAFTGKSNHSLRVLRIHDERGPFRYAGRKDQGALEGRRGETRRNLRFNLGRPANSREQAPAHARAARTRTGRPQPDSRRARLCAGAGHPPRLSPSPSVTCDTKKGQTTCLAIAGARAIGWRDRPHQNRARRGHRTRDHWWRRAALATRAGRGAARPESRRGVRRGSAARTRR
jgi:hypothetical protein